MTKHRERQYKKLFKKKGWRRNYTGQEWNALASILQARRDKGKGSEVYMKDTGKRVESAKIHKRTRGYVRTFGPLSPRKTPLLQSAAHCLKCLTSSCSGVFELLAPFRIKTPPGLKSLPPLHLDGEGFSPQPELFDGIDGCSTAWNEFGQKDLEHLVFITEHSPSLAYLKTWSE